MIAHGATRDEALDRLSAALRRTIVAGPKSNVRFLRLLADHPDFRAGKLDTGLIEREKVALGAVEQPVDAEAVAAGVGACPVSHMRLNGGSLFRNRISDISERLSAWRDLTGFALEANRFSQDLQLDKGVNSPASCRRTTIDEEVVCIRCCNFRGTDLHGLGSRDNSAIQFIAGDANHG